MIIAFLSRPVQASPGYARLWYARVWFILLHGKGREGMIIKTQLWINEAKNLVDNGGGGMEDDASWKVTADVGSYMYVACDQ